MGNACKPFGYTIDEGMKFFSIVEMFMAVYHIVVAGTAFDYMIDPMLDIMKAANKIKERSIAPLFYIVFIVILLLFVGLIIQAIMGILLFFLGYKNRNVTICFFWIIIACINFTCPLLVLLLHAFRDKDDRDHNRNSWFWFWAPHWLYLFYLILGVWIVVSYMKWARSTGIATRFTVAPAPAPAPSTSKPDESRHGHHEKEEESKA